jgi:hypothetical protein
MADLCAERLRLKQLVVASIDSIYSAKREYEGAKAASSKDVALLSDALNSARSQGRAVKRALDAHVAEHHCRE